jgi:hypothetical protein
LHPNELAGRLEDFRRGVFARLRGMERPEPTRLRLLLAAGADPEAVRELLAREQECCAFLAFTITPQDRQLLVDLHVPAEAAAALDGIASLAGPAAAEVAR